MEYSYNLVNNALAFCSEFLSKRTNLIIEIKPN